MRLIHAFALILTVLCIAAAAPFSAHADLQKGVSAYRAADYETAFAEFRKLAEAGDPHGQFNLAVMYLTGRGIEADIAKSVEWHRKAADQGLAAAQHGLGVLHYKGDGVPQDFAEALKWFRLAAAQQFSSSEFNLAAMHFNEQGVVRNDLEIVKWISLSAARDFPAAQFRLGEMYEKGIILGKDSQQALHWYRLAVKNGQGVEAVDGAARVERALGLTPGTIGDPPASDAPNVDRSGPTVSRAERTIRKPAASFPPLMADSARVDPADVPPAPAMPREKETVNRTPDTPNRAMKWRVQFASFRSEAEAAKAWTDLKQRAGGLLTGLVPIIVRADLGARGIFHRLQTETAGDRVAAEDLCRRLKETVTSQSCLTVRVSAGS